MEDFRHQAAPVLRFAERFCTFDPAAWAATDDLYSAWCCYAQDEGHECGAKMTLVANLRAAFPGIERQRVRHPIGFPADANIWGYRGIGPNTAGGKIAKKFRLVA